MADVPEEPDREQRIRDEAVVDAYGPVEQAMGWYYYLDGRLHCPCSATCCAKRATSPLKVGETVEVLGMADEEECEHDMLVTVRWRGEELAVPLAQLRPTGAEDETLQAIEDWHYWVARGYEF